MAGFYATIARLYDAEHFDKTEDLPFYQEMVEEYSDPVLVIGAGTGRVVLYLAAQGYTVYGIENEPAMLDRANAKLDEQAEARTRVTLYAGDALRHRLDVAAQTTIIPYNTLTHFHTQDAQMTLLRQARTWTAQGGVLLIDLPNAGEAYAGGDTGAVTLERTFIDRESGHLVMQHSVSQLDRAMQMMHVTWIYDEVDADGLVRRTVAPLVNRYFFLSEIQLLLRASGFTEVEAYGDFDYSPFEDGAPRMIVVAQ